MKSVLVTGGAGYIGSFMVERLAKDGVDVTILDSLERSKEQNAPKGVSLKVGSLLDKAFVKDVFNTKFDAVVHFAAYISVKESTEHLGMYFENNVQATVNLLEEMVSNKVSSLVFSSSAAVYGNPTTVPIPEDHQKNPESPYGESKLMVERVLSWYAKMKSINSVSLRYFNASGAALDGSRGETHDPEIHIIPCAIKAIRSGTTFSLYGSDYSTPDGTCLRDYIHVLDLAEAHVLSLQKLEKDQGAFAYNVGTGKGYSNKEVVAMIEEVSGQNMQVEMKERRPGDPAVLVADPAKIQNDLGFTPTYSDLKTVVSSAWKWHTRDA